MVARITALALVLASLAVQAAEEETERTSKALLDVAARRGEAYRTARDSFMKTHPQALDVEACAKVS